MSHDKKIIQHSNDFRVFFSQEDAYQLLRFALSSEKPKADQDGTLHQSAFISNFVVCVGGISHEYAETMRLLEYINVDNEGAVVDVCVSVDLCRPYHHSIHMISIYNGGQRYHSNCTRTDTVSYLLHRTGMLTWCPNSPSEQTQHTPDYVVISDARKRQFPWCIEGIAVEADSPVAIRVDISNKNANNRSWIPVAEGALLRAMHSVDVSISQGPNKGHAIISVQLIPFPKPFLGDGSESVRVVIVESNGREVGVSLLIATSKKKFYTDTTTTTDMTTTDSVGSTKCTENFDLVDDYRNWWYRLQAVRDGVHRALPTCCEINRKLNDALNEYDNGMRQTDTLKIEASCFDRYDQNKSISMIYAIVYGFLLAVVFPIMLAINLDHIETTHANTTNASHYTMAHPNPERILRTICWQSSSHPQSPPPVPWTAVFSPFPFAAVFALIMLVLRGREVDKIHKLATIARAGFHRCDQKLKAVYAEGRTQIQAIADQVSADPKIRNTVEAAILDHTSDNDNRMKNRKAWSVVSNEHFGVIHVFFMCVDLLVLIICGFAAMTYAVAEWCRVHLIGPQETVILPVIYVLLCGAANLVIGGFLFRYKPYLRVDVNNQRKIKRITMVVAGTVLLQQFLFLFELFTFFHRVSFVLVLMPLLIIIVCIYSCACGSTNFTLTIFLAPIIASIVLLMLKADMIFGIGTALLVGPGYPEAILGPAPRSEFSWVVIMIPVWLVLLLLPLAYLARIHEGAEIDSRLLIY